MLVTADVDMAREVLIKQFDKFTTRRVKDEITNLIFEERSDRLPLFFILNEKTWSHGNLYRNCYSCFLS